MSGSLPTTENRPSPSPWCWNGLSSSLAVSTQCMRIPRLVLEIDPNRSLLQGVNQLADDHVIRVIAIRFQCREAFRNDNHTVSESLIPPRNISPARDAH